MSKMKKWSIRLFGIGCILAVLCVLMIFLINLHIKRTVKPNILTTNKAAELEDVDCILVLGCGVRSDGSPSLMLRDRLNKSIELYNLEVSPKLLMSGDHGKTDYDEVSVMKEFAIDTGIASEDIFMDHAGFSTYESMYRAKEIFGAKKVVIVTQEYHLYRALYVAQELGIEAYGVAADYEIYAGQSMRDMREVLARAKDFASTIFKPKPTYLGKEISLAGSGDVTND